MPLRNDARRGPGPTPVPLIVRSAYSLGRGTALPGDLVSQAVALGYDTLALTDRDNLYAALPFLRACSAAGLRPILGAEVTGGGGRPHDSREPPRGMERGACSAPISAVLLARNASGYRSLCRILTARHLAADFDLAERVAAEREGLTVLVRHPALLERLHPSLPAGALYGAIVRPGSRMEEDLMRRAAARVGRPLAGTIDVYFRSAEEHETHRLLTAVRELELVGRLAGDRCAGPERHLISPPSFSSLFADEVVLLAAAREIALSCVFGPGDLPPPGSLFPKLPLGPDEAVFDRLHRMASEGLRRRYRKVTRAVSGRLAWELEQIDTMGFSDYFVVVGEICASARARGIPTVGRGSGASSLVAYLLGITNVDPLRYGLTFERFLHRLRRDLPDLDIDLCWRRRDEVIAHVYQTYGADRVAMISTHNHYQPRGAFREAARAFGLASEEIERLSRAIPGHARGPLEQAIASTALGRRIDLMEPPLPDLIAASEKLLGLPHTLGIHCGGIVIGPGRLDDWVPLERATKGIVVTQYEMHGVEGVGLVKIDLLGNRALSTIAGTLETIAAAGERPPALDLLPDPDGPTGEILSRGDAIGLFQIESPGMRNLLKMLGTRDLEGTIAALSLIRPGPAGSGMKERFIRRFRGLEQTSYLHPSLVPLLERTYGVLLYEEDVICVASAIGGFDRAMGDLMRRAIGGAMAVAVDPSLGERPSPRGERRDEDPWAGRTMREIENRFVASAVGNGIEPDVAVRVWGELARFGSYAFCKAHASGYGALAYQTAYLKAHHPGPFYAALLNNHQGIYPLRVYVEDARRHGIRPAPPCVHRSAIEWTWDGAELRCALGLIRGISRRLLGRIIEERSRRRFESLDDFLARAGPAIPEAESLILCGALDDVGAGPRPAKLWRVRCLARDGARRPATDTLRLEGTGASGPSPWREFDLAERVESELAVLGIAISDHPVRILRGRAEREGKLPMATPAAQIGGGQRARLIGLPAAARRVATKRGDWMLFLTIEDESGLAECTLFPDAYRAYGHLAHQADGRLLWVDGPVEAPYGAPSLSVERMGLLG